jgi:hypothetical protein
MAQTVRATTDRWCNHLHLLHGGPTILMVHYEEKKIYLRLHLRHWLNDFLVLNFKHADRNNNQVAQSLRFTNNAQCTHFVFAQKNVEIIRVSGHELMSSALTRLKVRQSTSWHLTVKHLSESLLIITDL